MKTFFKSRMAAIAKEIASFGFRNFDIDTWAEIMYGLELVDPHTHYVWLHVCLARGLLKELDRPDATAPRLFAPGRRFSEYLPREGAA